MSHDGVAALRGLLKELFTLDCTKLNRSIVLGTFLCLFLSSDVIINIEFKVGKSHDLILLENVFGIISTYAI